MCIHIYIYIYTCLGTFCCLEVSQKYQLLAQLLPLQVLRSVFIVSNRKISNWASQIRKKRDVAHLSVLSQISNCQGLGRKNKHGILKTDRTSPRKPLTVSPEMQNPYVLAWKIGQRTQTPRDNIYTVTVYTMTTISIVIITITTIIITIITMIITLYGVVLRLPLLLTGRCTLRSRRYGLVESTFRRSIRESLQNWYRTDWNRHRLPKKCTKGPPHDLTGTKSDAPRTCRRSPSPEGGPEIKGDPIAISLDGHLTSSKRHLTVTRFRGQ